VFCHKGRLARKRSFVEHDFDELERVRLDACAPGGVSKPRVRKERCGLRAITPGTAWGGPSSYALAQGWLPGGMPSARTSGRPTQARTPSSGRIEPIRCAAWPARSRGMPACAGRR
jgi:hypothetical protein